MELFPEELVVPQLEQPHVETDMCRVQTGVLEEQFEYPVQVLDIIGGFHIIHWRGYSRCVLPGVP